MALSCWPPLRPRGLLSLTLRAARAALASCELHDPGLGGAVDAVRHARGQQGRQQQQQPSGGSFGCGGSSSSGSGTNDRPESSGSGGGCSSPRPSGQGGCTRRSVNDVGGCSRSGTVQHHFGSAGCSSLELQALCVTRDALATAVFCGQACSSAEGGLGSSSGSDGGAVDNAGESSGCQGSTCSIQGSAHGGGGGETSAGVLGAEASSSPGNKPDHTPGGRLHLTDFASRWWPLVVGAVWAAMRRPGGLTLVDGCYCRVLLPYMKPWELREGDIGER